MPFRLIAPDGTAVDITHRIRTGRNTSFTTVHFPLVQGGKKVLGKGVWTIELQGAQIHSPELDYHLMVMLDNPTIATDFRIEAKNVSTGQPFPIRVNLKEGGKPLLKATVTAQLLGPNDGVGNILSTNRTPQGAPNTGHDVLRSAAQAKLLQLLSDPSTAGLFASRGLPAVTLLDNGQAANADVKAADGIYSARFANAIKEGHYQFRVTARGMSSQGEFQRARTLTVFVQPVADTANTGLAIVSFIPQPNGSVIVRVRATPKDRYRNFLGPDYTDLIRIVSSQGGSDERLLDNLDGSYDMSFRLPSAAANPTITVVIKGIKVVSKPLNTLPKV
jgi:hypothetical protein